MKDVRDIRLIGIGFVAGMVLCYFLTLDTPAPPVNATVTMNLAQATPANRTPPDSRPMWPDAPFTPPAKEFFPKPQFDATSSIIWLDQPSLRKYGHPLLDTKEAPDFKPEQRMRIEPALKTKTASPGGVLQYDLIDLNYKLDLESPPPKRGGGLIDFNYKPDFKIPEN